MVTATRMMGLNQWARNFTGSAPLMEKSGEVYRGKDAVPYYLQRYVCADRQPYTECVQGQSRERVYLALRDKTGQLVPESIWNRIEMEMAAAVL